jgi:hypothetical protein
MQLQMKPACEPAAWRLIRMARPSSAATSAPSAQTAPARMSRICPNCQGELVPRPRTFPGLRSKAEGYFKDGLVGI